MGRLSGMRCYTAGPLDYMCLKQATKWRDQVENDLGPLGIHVLSPLKKPVQEKDVGETQQDKDNLIRLKKEGNFDEVRRIMKRVVRLDLSLVDRSDFIIAQIDTGVHLCGTYHEIIMADAQRKPTLLFAQGGKANVPNWIFGIVPHEMVFDSLDLLLGYVKWVDQGKIDPGPRWVFFDQTKM